MVDEKTVRQELDDYRKVQNILDKVVKQEMKNHFDAFHRSQDTLSEQVFNLDQKVTKIADQVSPIVQAWEKGNTVTKFTWALLKSLAWFAGLIIAVGGAILVIKAWIIRK